MLEIRTYKRDVKEGKLKIPAPFQKILLMQRDVNLLAFLDYADNKHKQMAQL